jgi:hypothetical protein
MCNYAPYAVETTLRKDSPVDGFPIVSIINVQAGRCKTEAMTGYEHPPQIILFSKASDSLSYSELTARNWYKSTWASGMAAWSGDAQGAVFCASDVDHSKQRLVNSQSDCFKSEIPFVYTSAIPFNESKTRHDWLILDYSVCRRIKGFDCFKVALKELAIWASDLEKSLAHSYQAKFPQNREVREPIASVAGFEVLNTKGSFDLGVEISPLGDVTPFGTPIPVKHKDILVSFNGVPIYNGWDLLHVVYEHAFNKGVDEPYNMLIERSGAYYKVEGGFYFDNSYRAKFLTNNSCLIFSHAFNLQAIEDFSFYTDKFLSCNLDQLTKKHYKNTKECLYVRSHISAFYRQFCPDISFAASWLGGWYVPFEGKFMSLLSKNLLLKGKGVSSRLLRAAVFHGTEEAVRSAINMPIGYDSEETLNSMLNSAKWGAAFGAGFELAAPIIFK